MLMAHVKTQIYLTPRQHRALSREARCSGISLAALIRALAEAHLDRPVAVAPRSIRGIVKLGRSGIAGTSRDRHGALDELLGRGPVR
jgi:hypothetical protein